MRDAAAVRRQVADDDLMFGRNALSSNCVKNPVKYYKMTTERTRMHSSMMRTVRYNGGVCPGGGCLRRGVSAWGGVSSGRGVCPGGVCLEGCLPGGCLPRG